MMIRSFLWRWTKRVSLLSILALVAAVPAGAFGLPALARRPAARHRMENVLTRTLGTPVEIAGMTWSWKQGLLLENVSAGATLRIDSVLVKPRLAKLLGGKLRARVILEKPEIVVTSPEAGTPQFRLPKRCVKLESVEIRDGSYTLKEAGSSRSVRIDGITTLGEGRLGKRAFRLDLESLSCSLDGLAVTGKGTLRLSEDGLRGELDVNDAAKDSAELRDALRAAGVTIRKAPLLSDPF